MMPRQIIRFVWGWLFLLAGIAAVAGPSRRLAAEDQTLVRGIKVLPDKAPDCSSLAAIVASVTRGCETNDQRAIAIYNFMRLTHYHRAYPSEPGGIPVLKEINCYGWSLCGGLHAEQSALWREMGWNWRFVGWPGHTTVEAFYDNRWHYLDVFLKFYAWMPDPRDPQHRTIAGEDDLQANPRELLTEAFVLDPSRRVMYAKDNQFEMIGERANWQAPAFLVCGDRLADIASALQRKNRVGPSEGWGGMQHATGDYSAQVNLAPGFSLTNRWDKSAGAWYWRGSQIEPCHTCGDKEIRNSPEKGPIAEPYLGPDWTCESYANGQLDFQPDLSHSGCLQSFAAAENIAVSRGGLVPAVADQVGQVIVSLQSPYLLTQARGTAKGVDHFEVSVDGGKTWKQADLEDFGAIVGGHVHALLRLTIRQRLEKLHIQATVQNNPFALPYLSPGKNVIAVSVATPDELGENRLCVTFAYRRGARRKSYEQMYIEGKEIARGHDASWEQTPTIVQKVFSADELPANFEIDVPTPKDLFPVFPRMVYVRREVLAAGQEPRHLPDEAKPADLRPGDVLKTLPNPLLTGTQPPPPRIVRPVKTVRFDLQPSHFVTRSGEVPTSDFLKWPKTPQEVVEPIAFLIGGSLDDLPALKDLAAARLVFTATGAHDRAPTKIAATGLRAPFESNQRYDFEDLGDTLGTTIVPIMPSNVATWNPPREFRVDVTRHLRSLLLGNAEFHGFALRVVPDRSVDDGWTVRVHLPRTPKVYLELDIYVPQ